jgi:uncharacterized CHY-type Zn-finger protein
MYTDDPIADFHRHDREQEAELKKLPVCEMCRQPIQSDDLYDIEGDLYCEECGDSLFKRHTENYIREE